MKKQTPAQALKKELKKTFPETKFSCTYDLYSGGDAIRISWTNGPTRDEVVKISSKYKYGNFDGMTDHYEINNLRSELPQVKFITYDRDISSDIVEIIEDKVRNTFTSIPEYDIAYIANSIIWNSPIEKDKEIVGISARNKKIIFIS